MTIFSIKYNIGYNKCFNIKSIYIYRFIYSQSQKKTCRLFVTLLIFHTWTGLSSTGNENRKMRSFRAIRLNLEKCWEIPKISNMKLNTVVVIGPCGQHVQHGNAMSAGAVAGEQFYDRDGCGSFRCCLCESGRRADVIATTSRIAWHCLGHSPQKNESRHRTDITTRLSLIPLAGQRRCERSEHRRLLGNLFIF